MTKETHYIPSFTRINGRKQESVCGLWILPIDHSNEPTCAKCQQWFDAIANEPQTAEEMFGEEKR